MTINHESRAAHLMYSFTVDVKAPSKQCKNLFLSSLYLALTELVTALWEKQIMFNEKLRYEGVPCSGSV